VLSVFLFAFCVHINFALGGSPGYHLPRMDTLYLPQQLQEEMIAYVQGLYPEEACGLIGGQDGQAARLYPVENALHSPLAFEMDPRQQIRAMLAMEGAGLELLAIYHSHPHGPARPSTSDVAQAYYPETAQIIISLADRARPALRVFLIADGHVTEIGLASIPS